MSLKSIFEAEIISDAQKAALVQLIKSYDDNQAQLMVPAFQYQMLREGYRILEKENQGLREAVKP